MGIKWSIENPTTSRLWEVPAIRDLQCLPGAQFVNTVMCHFGAPYKKLTSLMTNILELRGLEAICEHRRHEVVLKGTVQHRDDQGRVSYVNRSKLAGSYPVRLCEDWVQCTKHLVANDPHESGADPRHECLTFDSWLDKALTSRGDPWFPHIKAAEASGGPKILDSVAFGQHSQAELARRRSLRRQRSKQPNTKKAATGTGHRCGRLCSAL